MVESQLPNLLSSSSRGRFFSPPLVVFPSCVEAFFGQPRGVDDGQTADITSPRGYNLREQY